MCHLCGKDCCEYCCEENFNKKYLNHFNYKIDREKIGTIREIRYAGTSLDWLYQKNDITPQIEQLPPIPLESTWSLRPFICGYHINRFRIVEGNKVISVVLTHDNLTELYYDVLPLKKSETEEKRFSVEDVQELHDYIKLLFKTWHESNV